MLFLFNMAWCSRASTHREYCAMFGITIHKQFLIWADLPNTALESFWPRCPADRLHVTGITKTNLLDAWPNHDKLAAELSNYSRRVLICYNFGFESERYSDQMFENALKVWKAAAQSRPDIALILRSHRGKRHSDIEQKIAKVCKECPNIIRSERHYGIMAMATINDVMALVDCVISSPLYHYFGCSL